MLCWPGARESALGGPDGKGGARIGGRATRSEAGGIHAQGREWAPFCAATRYGRPPRPERESALEARHDVALFLGAHGDGECIAPPALAGKSSVAEHAGNRCVARLRAFGDALKRHLVGESHRALRCLARLLGDLPQLRERLRHPVPREVVDRFDTGADVAVTALSGATAAATTASAPRTRGAHEERAYHWNTSR